VCIYLHKSKKSSSFGNRSELDLLFDGKDAELDPELADGLRDLRWVKGRDLDRDLDRDRRRASDGLVEPRYGVGEYRFFGTSLSDGCRLSKLKQGTDILPTANYHASMCIVYGNAGKSGTKGSQGDS